MVRSCSAFRCTNRFSNSRPDIQFYRFPFARPEIFNKWITAVRRKDWFPARHSIICGEHFLPGDFQPEMHGIGKRLKPDAVPSKFDFSPLTLKKLKAQEMSRRNKKKKKKPAHKTKEVTNIKNASVSTNQHDFAESGNDSDNSSCSSNNSEILSSEEILKRKLEIMTALYEKTQKKLTLCQEQCKRYVKQVIALEEVIDSLRQINSVSDYS